jgi:hypothetical protein
LILDLVSFDGSLKVVAFFNVKKTKKGFYTVGHKSRFAKLYRSTIGDNPSRLKGKAHQLVKHFIGEQFYVDYKEALRDDRSLYFKATDISPIKPIETKEWFSNGELKAKARGRYVTKKNKNRTLRGKEQENKWKNAGNELETASPSKPNKNKGSEYVSSALKHTTSGVSPLTCVDMKVVSHNERIYTYEKKRGETLDEYHQRVIDETFCF